MEATTLKISNALNKLGDNYRIGNLLNKNLLIRNLALMRNIGKYSFYSEPMFPEVGMVYNVYEHVLHRPEDIGLINGVIGYNNVIDDDEELITNSNKVSGRFITADFSTNPDAVVEKKKKGILKDNDKKSDANVNNVSGSVRKTIYVTNSDSVRRSGGDIALGEVIKEVNKIFLPENQYVSDNLYSFGVDSTSMFGGMSVDRPTIINPERLVGTAHVLDGTQRAMGTYYKTYEEGTGYTSSVVTENENVGVTTQVNYIEDKEEYLFDLGNGEKNNKTGRLLYKTNKLFRDGKINSMISRHYVLDKDDGYISRGRNLKKEKARPEGHGYDNPYCRVWTIHNQYSKMTDLIRPRLEDSEGGEKMFATLEKIQAPYGSGLRPADGASRLSDMSVLKANGMVNFAPHKDENGELDKESIKRCMFSIENLAWKDIIMDENVVRKTRNGTNYVEESVDKVSGKVLTEEQKGPCGGRIMWFPPYNLRFSEDVVTNWNSNTFIGRGENMYTYVNTERGGSLSFTLLIDHPSVVNKWVNNNPSIDSHESEQKLLRFFAGCDDLGEENKSDEDPEPENATVPDPVVTPVPAPERREVKVFVFFPNNYSGVDDDISNVNTNSDYAVDYEQMGDTFLSYMIDGEGNTPKVGYEMVMCTAGTDCGAKLTTPIEGKNNPWGYKVDAVLQDEKLLYTSNTADTKSFMLNAFNSEPSGDIKSRMKLAGFINEGDEYGTSYYSFKDLCDALTAPTGTTWLWHLLNTDQIRNVEKIELRGYASSHGHEDKNKKLATRRAETIRYLIYVKKFFQQDVDKIFDITTKEVVGLSTTNTDVSSLEAKMARAVEVVFYVTQNKDVQGAQPGTISKPKENQNIHTESVVKRSQEPTWDDEYLYFKELKETDSILRDRITQKVKYFDPAFHSITPEGFNARLTFLHQCTRQGPTAAASDINSTSKNTGVGNLAFGRAPYCVLRIGDFYNTKILIESISINYDSGSGVQWDLNPEGVGVQPMMAEIQMRFKFVGGTDISGPIERLQNAVSFNYYSNASIYDRRADYRGSTMDVNGDPEGKNQVYFFDARTQGNSSKNIDGK